MTTRRQFLRQTGFGLTTASVFGLTSRVHLFGSDAPKFEILETKLIARHPGIYYGWATIGINPMTNELFVVASGREAHVCPFGRVDFFRSKDLGATWTWPQTIYDGPMDDRDSGVLVTKKGTILVTTFTSEAYLELLNPELERRANGEEKQFDDERLERWLAVHRRITDEERKKELGSWMIRSTDNGITWSARYATPFNSPHGPIECSDGRLLYPGRDIYSAKVGVAESLDDGVTWKTLGLIPPRDGDKTEGYHEFHGVEAADGTILVQIRNHNQTDDGNTLQTESTDGGKTWAQPHTIGVWGFPSHLWRLRDDRLVMTYGFRNKPIGNQARVSTDNGRSWSEPIIISGDGRNNDLGYPSTIQLPDGSLMTVWYENQGTTVLRMAHWKLF